MKFQGQLEPGLDEIRQSFTKQVLRKLPPTLQSYFNQQLRAWGKLFPYERRYHSAVLSYLEHLSDSEQAVLFNGIRTVEEKMQVSTWNTYSTLDQTLENASLLARSPYYLEWRKEVEKVFARIEQDTQASIPSAGPSAQQLTLLIFPAFLPMSAESLWERWPASGRQFRIESNTSRSPRTLFQELFPAADPETGASSAGLLESLGRRTSNSFSDVWVLDAGSALAEFFLAENSPIGPPGYATVLSFERLKPVRERFLAEVNRGSHALSSADEIYNSLRGMDIESLCPPEVNRQLLIREFVRSLLLSGNGSPLFGNAFVEWGAAELLRRARPSVLVGCFGTRDKPKPFTSVAVFENQSIANPLPPIKDSAGSALDAEILAYYIWRASARYPEYKRTLTVCIAESLATAFVLGPSDNPFVTEKGPLSLPKISSLIGAWLA
jgi:hypothetical protein